MELGHGRSLFEIFKSLLKPLYYKLNVVVRTHIFKVISLFQGKADEHPLPSKHSLCHQDDRVGFAWNGEEAKRCHHKHRIRFVNDPQPPIDRLRCNQSKH